MSDKFSDLNFRLDSGRLMPAELPEPEVFDNDDEIIDEYDNDVFEEPAVEIAEEAFEEPAVEAAEEVFEEPAVEIAEEVFDEPAQGEPIEDIQPISTDALAVPPEDDHADDKLLSELGKESIISHYNFINTACLCVLFLAIALTFILIRQGERYGEDNAQLTFESFIDGSYTSQLSRKFINELKLQDQIVDLKGWSAYLYGFSAKDDDGKPTDPTKPSQTTSQTTSQNVPGEAETTTTTTTVAVSNNPDVTGVPVTMETSPTQSQEDIFTGNVITTTSSLTTSFTTTMSYTPTATKPSETTAPSETTPSETTPSETTPSETTPSETTPSETTPSETTPSETTPSETTPSETTPSETTPSETTPSETETTPAVTTPVSETDTPTETSSEVS